ncbi:MAG: EAL domain-containing protein [Bacillota bacterium]
MKILSRYRRLFLLTGMSTWIVVVFFAFEYGNPTEIIFVFTFNILMLLVFALAVLLNQDEEHSLMDQLDNLMKLLFGYRTGSKKACLFKQGTSQSRPDVSDNQDLSSFGKTAGSIRGQVFNMGFHYPQLEQNWIQKSKQIRHMDDQLKVTLDTKGRVVKVSEDVAHYHNGTPKQFMRLNHDDLNERLSLDNPHWFTQVLHKEHAHAKGSAEYKGSTIKFFWFFKAIYDYDNRCVGIEGHARKITEFIDSQTSRADQTDPLTGLKNARGLYEALKNATLPKHAVAFFVDVDGFSKINDYYGYAFGDKVLIHLSKTLESIDEDRIVLGRMSADKFVLLFMKDDEEGIDQITTRMQSFTQISKTIEGVDILLNIKIGYALYPRHASTLEALIAKANLALKHSRDTAAYSFISYEHPMGDALKKQVHIAQRLKKAIEEDALDIHFQKIVDVRTGSATSVEALVRWTDAIHGRVNPIEIFEVAKSSGMTIMLEKVLVDTSLNLYRKLRAEEEYQDTRLALNLAPESLMDHDFLPYLLSRTQREGLSTKAITIEVSERIFMNDLEVCLERINAYKKAGFKIAIDDFGKDFSSLSILERIDFDVIKIDALFVKNIAIKKNQEIFKMVRRITDNVRQACIVEGVETKDQKHILEALGCYYQQGFFHHYPRPL